MRRRLVQVLAIAVLAGTALTHVLAGQSAPAGAPFPGGTIEGEFSGPIQGPWEWSKGAKITTADLTMTCDRLKVWLTKDGRGWDRVEATGHIVANGRYTAANKDQWKVFGRAESGTYGSQTGQGVLKGSVDFRASNLTTGAIISVSADKLTYDVKTRQFRFDKGGSQVKMEWQQPVQEEKAAAPPQKTEKGESKQ
jgi:lipopolysaccharide export system protein LptA